MALAGVTEGTARPAMRGGRLIHDNLVKIQQALERGGAMFLEAEARGMV